jgi:predicted Rossmann-fold nucleotide-binding protein
VLLGTSYWGGLVAWIRAEVLGGGKVSDKDVDLLRLTDDVDEAVAIMVEAGRSSKDEEPDTAAPDIPPHHSE